MWEHSSRWKHTVGFFLLALFGAGCGDSGTGQGGVILIVDPSSTLIVGVGSFTTLTVSTGTGDFVDPGEIDWSSDDPGVAMVSDRGLITARARGAARITARWSGSSATALIEVWIPVEVDPSADGTSFLGRNGYIEYLPGTLPFILSAPHGGTLTPAEIPDRTFGVTVTDRNTGRLAEQIRDAFIVQTGAAPHLVIAWLARIKLDPNREIVEAAQGSPFAENAWDEFHGFIETARAWVEEEAGSGLFVDLHGHGHEINRLELGYLTSGADLDMSDGVLDAGNFAATSSLKALVQSTGGSFSELLRGPTSLGALLTDEGVPAVPSPADPTPAGAPYFSGGFNTARYGSRDRGTVSGAQFELYFPGIRDTEDNRALFSQRFARVIEAFMTEHYGFFRPGG